MASLAVLKSRAAGRLTGLGLMALAMAACTTTGPDSGSMEIDVGRYVVGPAYQANGTTYTPQEDFAYAAIGTASWFGGEADGRRALTGEMIRADELLAAHRTLQLPSLVRVTSLDTGLSVVVRVVDREPVEGNAIIGVSRRAAELLGIERGPPSRVDVRILSAESLALAEMAGRPAVAGPAAPSRPLETATGPGEEPVGPAEDIARARLESAGLVPSGTDGEPIDPAPPGGETAAAGERTSIDVSPDSELLANIALADSNPVDGPPPDDEPTASDDLDEPDATPDTIVVGGAPSEEAQDRVEEARAEEVSRALALAEAEAARVASAREAQLAAEQERLEAEAAARAALVARAEAEARAASAAAAAADAVSDQPVVDVDETPAALADRRADEQTRAVAEARSIYPSLGLAEPAQPDQAGAPRPGLGSGEQAAQPTPVQTVSIPRRGGSSAAAAAETTATVAPPDIAEEAAEPAANDPSPTAVRPTGPSGLSAALVPAAEGTAVPQAAAATPSVTVAPVEAAVPPATEPTSSGPTRFFVQAGAFAVYDNAERLTERLSDIGSTSISPIVIDGRELFRVWMGPYLSVTDANGARDQLVGIGFGDARIVID